MQLLILTGELSGFVFKPIVKGGYSSNGRLVLRCGLPDRFSQPDEPG